MNATPRQLIYKFCVIFTASILIACASPKDVQDDPHKSVVAQYITAHNVQDIQAMAELLHDDVEWFDIDGSKHTVVTANKQELVSMLGTYFENNAASQAVLSGWSVNGNFVSAKESISIPTRDGGSRTQASTSVYEFEDGLIRRVWYFPAQTE